MNNEKMVLQSSGPLDGGVNSGALYYVLFGIGGLVLSAMICLLGGSFDILAILVFTILSVLVGWGIRNKMLKYKSFGLRKLRFLADAKPQSTELYQRLAAVFTPLNMKVELDQSGIVSVYHNGIYYDVVFNQDDSFSLYWRQSLIKSMLRHGYYISVYKKALVSMGLIAYHVQRVCLNDNESYGIPVQGGAADNNMQANVAPAGTVSKAENNLQQTVGTNGSNIPQTTKKKSHTGLIVALICVVAGVVLLVGSFLFFWVIGYTSIMNSDDMNYAAIVEEYPCDTGGHDNERLYEMYQVYMEDYLKVELDSFVDLTGLEAGMVMDEYMSYNSDYVGTPLIVEGEVTCINGDIIEIIDSPNEEEAMEIYESGYWYLSFEAYYAVDIGMTQIVEEDLEVGDKIMVVGMYCGKMEVDGGEYIPSVMAMAFFDPDDFS